MTVTGTDRWVSFAPMRTLVGERKPQLVGTPWKNHSPSGPVGGRRAGGEARMVQEPSPAASSWFQEKVQGPLEAAGEVRLYSQQEQVQMSRRSGWGPLVY